MSIPRKNILATPEGIATYNQIIAQDSTYFPEGNIPLIYKPTQTRDKSAYWHEDLFQALNQQIANIDEDLPQYNYTEDVIMDQKEGYVPFNKYRAILSNQSTKIPIFSKLTPTHQKRIVDQEALDMSALHNYVISAMPKDMENDDKKRLMQTYNRYFSENILPQTVDRMRKYSARQSVDASNENIKRSFLTTLQSGLEGIGSTAEAKLGMEDLNNTFEGWADNVKGWINELETGTGIYAMSDEEVARDIGEYNLHFVTVPTFKSGYLFNKVAEGFAQQIITSGLPMATGFLGGVIGAPSGPIGALGGFLVGTGLGVLPGFAVESGSFEEEMTDNWQSLREHAKQAKEGGWYSPEEFKSMFTVPLDEDGTITITADQLTNKTIEDISENLSQAYALKSTAYEFAGTALSWMGGKAFTAVHGKLMKAHFASKLGQKASANRFFKIVKKPLAPVSKVVGEVSQEGWVEGEQEDINMSMMEPYMSEYNRMSEGEKDRRIKSARFQGGIMGGGFNVVGQLYDARKEYQKTLSEQRGLQEEERQDARDINLIHDEIKESRKKNKPYINDDDLIVQIAMAVDPTLSDHRDNIITLADDPSSVDNLIAARRSNNQGVQNSKSLAKILLQNKQKTKKMMNRLGLTAAHFVGRISKKDFISLFDKKQADKLFEKLKMDEMNEDTSREEIGDYTDSMHNEQYDGEDIDAGNQVVDNKIADLVKQHNQISNSIKKQRMQKKKISPAQLNKQKQLANQINALKKSNTTKENISKNQDNVNTITGELNETDPTNITTLKLNNLVSKDKAKMAFIKDKKNLDMVTLNVVSKSTEVNPKTKKKETVYVVQPSISKQSMDKDTKLSNTAPFKVFQSEIDIAVTKVGNKPPKRWKVPVSQEEKTNYLDEQVITEKETETKESDVHPAILAERKIQKAEQMQKDRKRPLKELRDIAKERGWKEKTKKAILAKLEAEPAMPLADEVFQGKEEEANLQKLIDDYEASPIGIIKKILGGGLEKLSSNAQKLGDFILKNKRDGKPWDKINMEVLFDEGYIKGSVIDVGFSKIKQE